MLPNHPPLSESLRAARDRWVALKAMCTQVITRSSQRDVSVQEIFFLLDKLREDLSYFTEVATIPGLGQYAREQYNSPEMNIEADFTDMIAALEDAVTWIVTALPKASPDGQGNEYLLIFTLTSNGTRVQRMFTPAQTSGLRTVLTAISDTIS